MYVVTLHGLPISYKQAVIGVKPLGLDKLHRLYHNQHMVCILDSYPVPTAMEI